MSKYYRVGQFLRTLLEDNIIHPITLLREGHGLLIPYKYWLTIWCNPNLMILL